MGLETTMVLERRVEEGVCRKGGRRRMRTERTPDSPQLAVVTPLAMEQHAPYVCRRNPLVR